MVHTKVKEAVNKHLGKQFTLKCGTIVTVVEYLSAQHVVIEDEHGRRKSCKAFRIRTGDVSWFKTKSKIAESLIGKHFELNCGVTVIVLPSENCRNLLVSDELGNTKIVNKGSLLKGEISWKEFGEDLSIKIGQGFLLNSGIAVTVKEILDKNKVTIEDIYGTCVTTTIPNLKEGYVRWPVTENEQFAYGKRMTKIGDEYLLKCGVTVRIIEYNNNEDIIVADDEGNSRKVAMRKLKRGTISWKEFGVRTIKMPEIAEIGYKYTTTRGVELEVVEYKDANNIIVKDSKGITKKTNAESIYTKTTRWNKQEEDYSWNYLNVDLSSSYVYIVKHKDIVLYVGKGKNERYLHPTSGTSHCLELNRLFFIGIKVEVSILKDGLTDSEARELESKCIEEMKPQYNQRK